MINNNILASGGPLIKKDTIKGGKPVIGSLVEADKTFASHKEDESVSTYSAKKLSSEQEISGSEEYKSEAGITLNYKDYLNEDGTFNMAKAVTSGYGQLLLNTYLDESKLSNIFEEYQSMMQSIDKQQQASLEDAYFQREMSKKYLGEYASNNGVGDVSGNLMDIYSGYQQNKSEIDKYFGEQKLSLEGTYNSTRSSYITEQLQNTYNLNVAQLDEKAQEVLFNATQGDFGEYDNRQDYIDSMRETLGEDLYRAITTELETFDATSDTIAQNKIITNLENGAYGLDANGNPQDFRTYYEQNRDNLPSEYQDLYDYKLAVDDKNAQLEDLTNEVFSGEYANKNAYINHLDSLRLQGEITQDEYDSLTTLWDKYEIAQTTSFGNVDSGFDAIPLEISEEFGSTNYDPSYYSNFDLPEGVEIDNNKAIFKRGDGQYIFATDVDYDASVSTDILNGIKEENKIEDIVSNVPYAWNGKYYVLNNGTITEYTKPTFMRTSGFTQEEASNNRIYFGEDGDYEENVTLDGTEYKLSDKDKKAVKKEDVFKDSLMKEILSQNGISEGNGNRDYQVFGFVDGRYYSIVAKKNVWGNLKYYLYDVNKK